MIRLFSRTLDGFPLALFALLFFSCTTSLADTDIGKIVILKPSVWVKRDGKANELALHDGIQRSDSITTTNNGLVDMQFEDGTTISLGSNTSMSMMEFINDVSNPSFFVDVSKGLLRTITGKMVKMNPDGFKVAAPMATIGIRGSTVSVRIEKGQRGRPPPIVGRHTPPSANTTANVSITTTTTVYVEQTSQQVIVNGVDVPSGFKYIVYSGAPGSPGVPGRLEQITEQDREALMREFASDPTLPDLEKIAYPLQPDVVK